MNSGLGGMYGSYVSPTMNRDLSADLNDDHALRPPWPDEAAASKRRLLCITRLEERKEGRRRRSANDDALHRAHNRGQQH